LSEFGRNPEGGVTRLGFSQTEMDARTYVMSLMKEAGLEIRVDPAGNIFGRRPGSDQLPTILFGSTPMYRRRDALAAAAKDLLGVRG
jgi:N-carbamoyl-L-amino-acid hydrolase